MELNFVKVNPSGNTTVLILDPLPRTLYAHVASKVMKGTSLAAEQVGFIEPATMPGSLGRLQMMGGEFCGNASRGFAAWLIDRNDPGIHLAEGVVTTEVPIEVSGHGGVLKAIANIELSGKHIYSVAISMPLPRWVKQGASAEGKHDYTLVGFEGIVHAVVWNRAGSKEQFDSIRADVERQEGVVDCLGVMFYSEETRFLTPVVHVREVGSLVWESSCGSGSVAVAAALANRDRKSVEGLRLSQPGGVIRADVTWQGRVVEAGISGDVAIEAAGVVYVDL
jgi:histidine racemase